MLVWNNLLLCILILKGKQNLEQKVIYGIFYLKCSSKRLWLLGTSLNPLIPSIDLSLRENTCLQVTACHLFKYQQWNGQMETVNDSVFIWAWFHMFSSGQPVQKFQCPSICPHPDQNPSSQSRGTASTKLLFMNLDRAWIMFWWNCLNQYKLFVCNLYFHLCAKYLYFRVASNSELKCKHSVYAGASEKAAISSSNITLR